jgi:alkaline phosphatase D
MNYRTLALTSFIAVSLPLLAAADPLTSGPMVGATDHASAWVWAQGSGVMSVRVEGPGLAKPKVFGGVPFDPARADTARVRVTDLQPSSAYAYEVLVNDEPAGKGTFRTLPKPGTGKVRIAFGSCLKVGYAKTQPVFAAIAEAKADAFLWLGDACYFRDADSAESLWTGMAGARALPSLRTLLANTPNLAQWDDHDYGPNDGDKTYGNKETAREVFAAYWANPSVGEDGEGIYTRASLGPVDLFLCDNRWFRDPNRAEDTPQKGILGKKQTAWLLAGLAASTAPIKIVATGGQFLARYHQYESWDTARHERDGIIAAIRAKKIGGVIFISGDRHFAEVNRWKGDDGAYDLWDVTSSPLSNRYWPAGSRVANPDRVYSYGGGTNFGWIEVDADTKTVTLQLRNATGATLWSDAPAGLFVSAPLNDK